MQNVWLSEWVLKATYYSDSQNNTASHYQAPA